MKCYLKKKKKLSHNQIRYVDGGSIKERKHAKSGSFIWPTAHTLRILEEETLNTWRVHYRTVSRVGPVCGIEKEKNICRERDRLSFFRHFQASQTSFSALGKNYQGVRKEYFFFLHEGQAPQLYLDHKHNPQIIKIK